MHRLFKKNYYTLARIAEYGVAIALVTAWIFIAKPQLFTGIPFPPGIREALALIETLSPDGAGTYQEWDVTGAATHWQAVNDSSDTTYISTGVDEERDTQTLSNLLASTGLVQQVDVVMRCVVSGGGGAVEKAANFIREGSTDTEGTLHTISRSAYTDYTTSYTTNPRTGIAWTTGQVNSLEAGVRLKTIGSGEVVRCSEIYVTQSSATAKMSAFRWFTNADSTDVGVALANQDTAYTLTSDGQAFRLRLLLHVAATQLAQNSEPMKLQFAAKSGTCDALYSGESWSDVTASTAIAFNNNATPADEATLTTNGSDPSDGHTKVTQTYQEANNFQNSVAAVPSAQDGIWDFSLVDFSASAGASYCFRVIKTDANVIVTPTVVPEITMFTPNTAPTGTLDSATQATDGTGNVTIGITVADANADKSKAKFEYETTGSACDGPWAKMSLGTSTPSGFTADTGGQPDVTNANDYQLGTTATTQIVTSASNDGTLTWNSKVDLASANGTYCFRLTVNDGTVDQTTPDTQTLTLDNVSPTSAGNLTFLNRGTSTIALAFGSDGSDTNAPGTNAYKLYYKAGTSGVATTDTEKDSTDFDRYDYGEGDDGNDFNALTWTGLSPATNYVFNIWTYDNYGNSSNATEYTTTTESFPTGSFNSASQKTTGSGIVDISTEIDDADDFTTRLMIDYQATSACNSWSDPTLQTPLTADFNDTGGAPDINNGSTYQVGSGTNTRVITSSGSNTVDFDWASNTDQSSGNATMCLRLTANDSHSTTLELTNAIDDQMSAPSGDDIWNRGGYDAIAVGRGASAAALQRSLVKFDVQGVPAGATITSATLTLTCISQFSTVTETIDAYKLLRTWSEGKETTFVTNVDASWAYSDYSTAWGTAGASNTTNDRSSSSMGSVSVGNACANQAHTITLDATTVSGWVNDPASNYGMVLKGDEAVNNTIKGFASNENATASYRPKLTIIYATDSDQSSPATQTLTVDNVNPATPGSMTYNSKSDTTVTLNLGTDSSDTNDPGTNNYRLFYKVGASAPAETDTEFDSVAFDSWDPGATITVTGLTAGTQYTFNIWAYDTYCQTTVASCTKNKAAAATPVTVTTSGKPTGSINYATQLTDGSGIVAISSEIDDPNDDLVKFKLEYDTDNACNGVWNDPTLVTASSTADFNDTGGIPSVVNTDAYQVGTTATRRVKTASGSNTVLVDWQSNTDQSSGNTTMCVRLTANDDTDDQATPGTQTVLIDNVNPVVGNLTDGGKTATTVTLIFPAAATETNFDRYRIFYKAGASGVTEANTEHSDSDLLSQTYGGTADTTVTGLTANTQYVFNVWAYDDYCTTNYASCSKNKASGSEVAITTTNAGNYTATGSLISSSIDTQSYATIANNSLLRVKWTQSVPSACVLDLYFRGTNAGTPGSPDYTGVLWTHVTTTATTSPGYYTPTSRMEDLSDESSLQGKRWFQYLVDMHSCNSQNSTPELTGVWLEYD